MWTGNRIPERFWADYLQTLRGALLLSIVFGLGAFSYATMRERLRQTEERLHEKEVAEERTRKLAAEARLRSLESRLHPHFLFNTLNSISALIAVDPARAEQVVGRLAALLRSSLDTTTRSLIPLEQELAIVQDYVDIERARFGDRLQGRVEVPAELRDAQVPPLSVQSLVENAVKHGISPERGGGEVCVSASALNGQLRIAVSDTGAGFDLVRGGGGPRARLAGRPARCALQFQGPPGRIAPRGAVRRGDGAAPVGSELMRLRAYLVDDEPLAIARLTRLLGKTGRVEVIGSTGDPEEAVEALIGDPSRRVLSRHPDAPRDRVRAAGAPAGPARDRVRRPPTISTRCKRSPPTRSTTC